MWSVVTRHNLKRYFMVKNKWFLARYLKDRTEGEKARSGSSRDLFEYMGRKGAQSPLWKHAAQVVSQTPLRFTGTEKYTMSSQFYNSWHKNLCLSLKNGDLGPNQHWIGPGKRKDDGIRIGIEDKDTRPGELSLPGPAQVRRMIAAFGEIKPP